MAQFAMLVQIFKIIPELLVIQMVGVFIRKGLLHLELYTF